MSKQAYSREQARRKPLADSEQATSLPQNPFAAVDHTPPANTSESAPPLNTGHDFGQIAIQPAPTAAPQMKLRVSQPGDVHEREADQVAEQVMRMPDSAAASGGDAPTHAPTPESATADTIPSGGQPLDATARAFMEPRFGHDFGHVRVHTDEQAAEAASGYRARAYTVGSDIVFGAQEYAPDTSAGQHLLAHELTHVVQQEGDATAAATVQREPEGAHGPPQVAKDLPAGVQEYTEGAGGGPGELEDENLAAAVMGAQLGILTGWKTALDNFFVVLESKSDKEASPDFQKAMGKFFRDQALGKIGAVTKWVSEEVTERVMKPVDVGIEALKTLNEEVKRAEEAKESGTLRDFYVQHNTAIGKMTAAAQVGTPKLVDRVGKIRDAMFRATDTKKGAATEALNDAADKYTTMRMVLSDAYTDLQGRVQFSTPESIFRVLTEEWIRGSTVKQGWATKEASVVIRMNRDLSVKDAHIQGTGGQKIAEQLVKDAPDGVDFYSLEVKKEIEYYGFDDTYPSAYVHLDSENHIYGAIKDDDSAAAVNKIWEYIKSDGVKALTAKKVDGD